jgi:V/A-type H+-transporting ATPase subunit E
MAEELKGLIEKIREEGIAAAEAKARAIEDEARRRAEAVLKEARRESERIMAETKARIAKMEESTRASLAQAGRDTIILLRKEVNATLEQLVASRVRDSLYGIEELAKIIHLLVKSCSPEKAGDIVISLKKEDLERLKSGLLADLKEELKKGIVLKPSDEISGGLVISFDKGKSHFDFTDKAICEYISGYIKPALSETLKDALSGGKD